MINIGGIVVLVILVFGIYILSGGSMDIVLHALPAEGGTIGGAAAATVVIGNSIGIVMKIGKDLGAVVSGSKWKTADYRDLLCLMYTLTKLAKSKGAMGLEPHIENPHESTIFREYPRILGDHFAVDLICDTLRMVLMSCDNPHVVEEALDRAIEKHHHESLKGAKALGSMADALPALGIVPPSSGS